LSAHVNFITGEILFAVQIPTQRGTACCWWRW
jgi:hypothetical protein